MGGNTVQSVSSDRSPGGVQNLRFGGGEIIGLGWRFQSVSGGGLDRPAVAISSVWAFFGISAAAAKRVEKYIEDRADPDEGARMAAGFTVRYRALRSEGAEPAEVFRHLLIFAGGATGDPDREVAALAIVTHFFATCQIFEQPTEVGHDPA